MAESLIRTAKQEAPEIQIFAQTLSEINASTHILEKLNFKKTAELDHPEDGRIWEWELE